MDLEVLCKSLNEAKDKDSRLEILTDIKTTISRLGITYHNIQKFFEHLNEELRSKESQIILAVNQILIEVINSDTPEVEPQFPALFKSLIAHFEDVEVPIREASLNVILEYIRKTRNIENVLVQYNKCGILSPNVTIRRKSIKYLPIVIEAEKNIFNTQTGIYEMRKTIENLIVRLKDESDLVQQEAEKTLWLLWKSFKSLEKILPKLAIEHQNTFENRITVNYEKQAKLNPELKKRKLSLKNIPEVQRIFKLDIGLLELKGEEVSPEKKKTNPPPVEEWPVSKNGMYFGFVSAQEMKGLTNQEDWKKRLVSIESVEQKIMSFTDFFDLNAYLTSFVNFLKTLLEDSHLPVLVSIYTILSRVLDIPGSKNKIALHSLLPVIMPKLSDKRVALRQECLFLCAKICKMMKLEVALGILVRYLDNTQNWHMKEETLKLIIVSYLNTYSEGKIQSDQELVLTRVAPLVDDQNPKVQIGALETLTVICYSTNTTTSLEMLERLVDRDAYEIVIDGLSEGKVAYVGGSQVIDFAREKYQYLLEMQQIRSQHQFMGEVKGVDARQLNHNDPDFDWKQFVMPEDDEEDSESQGSVVGANAAKNLVKDPKLDLNKRLKANLKGKGLYHQKQYVQVVDENTETYKDYQYAGRMNKADPNMILFTKDIPPDVLSTLREEEGDEEDEVPRNDTFEVKEEEKKEEKVDRDPLEILDDIFDNGQPGLIQDLPKDQKKLIGELKHIKRKKKNKKELYEEQPLDPEEQTLLPDEALKPLSFPDFYLENILLDLKVDDWFLQFEALNNLRRVGLHSQETLYNQKFSIHNLVKQALLIFQSSSKPILLRNILLGLKLLFEKLNKVLDADIDDIINILLDKTFKEDLTQRTFMEMKYCLGAMIHHLSSDRIIIALAKFLHGEALQGQLMLILCIEKLIGETSIYFSSFKGAGVLLNSMVKCMTHRAYKIRACARRTFYKLVECGYERKELERFFSDSVSREDYAKFIEFMQRTDALRERMKQVK